MIPDGCIEETCDSHVSVSDKKSTSAAFANPKRQKFRKMRFDGCVVKNQTACDWIVEKTSVGRIAVELKGAHVAHAALQVECGLRFLKAEGLDDLRMAGLVIASRYPRIDTQVQRAKDRLMKQFHARLHVLTDGRDLRFEKLLGLES